MGAETALQTSIYGALSGIGYPVFDDVPENQAAPYIVIGDTTLNQFNTDGVIGFDCTCTIHAWSAQRGRKQCKEMQGAIFNALDRAELAVVGFVFVGADFEQSLTLVDADGIHRHGVQIFRVKFTQ